MKHLKFGLMFVGLVAAQHSSASEKGHDSKLDLSKSHVMHLATEFIPPYRFTASVVLTQPDERITVGAWPGISPKRSPIDVLKEDAGHVESFDANTVVDSERVSLQRLLRLEFKGDLLKLTLRPKQASIEGDQVKLTFRHDSTWVVWKKDLH